MRDSDKAELKRLRYKNDTVSLSAVEWARYEQLVNQERNANANNSNR